MPYRLVLANGDGFDHAVGDAARKAIGENVFAAEMAAAFPCYVFYYPGAMLDPTLEHGLRAFGEQTGQNLFVNIGRLNDPAFGKVAKLFGIVRTPAIVVTAIAPLSTPEGANLSAFVRLDSALLLASPDRTLKCVDKLFILFLQGEVARAIATGKWSQRAELLQLLAGCIRGAFGSVRDFVAERDLSVSLFEGRFELTRSGD
jgi:hypothetical protein